MADPYGDPYGEVALTPEQRRAQELAQSAGTVPGDGAAPIPGQTAAQQTQVAAGAPQSVTPPQGRYKQFLKALPQYAQYGALGLAGGQTTGGTLAAAAAAGLLAMQRQRQEQAARAKQAPSTPATSSGGWGSGDDTGFKHGGKVMGKTSEKVPVQKKAYGGTVNAGQREDTRMLNRVKGQRMPIEKAPVFKANRTPIGKFARGGLVKGTGVAIKGCNGHGEV